MMTHGWHGMIWYGMIYRLRWEYNVFIVMVKSLWAN
jgi:hypothetical protein